MPEKNNHFLHHKQEGGGRCRGVGGGWKERNKTGITNILTNKETGFYKQKSTVVADPGAKVQRTTKKCRLSKGGGYSGGGVGSLGSWGRGPSLLYYLGNSSHPVLTCTKEPWAPFPLYFISCSETLWKLLKTCEQSLAVKKIIP